MFLVSVTLLLQMLRYLSFLKSFLTSHISPKAYDSHSLNSICMLALNSGWDWKQSTRFGIVYISMSQVFDVPIFKASFGSISTLSPWDCWRTNGGSCSRLRLCLVRYDLTQVYSKKLSTSVIGSLPKMGKTKPSTSCVLETFPPNE